MNTKFIAAFVSATLVLVTLGLSACGSKEPPPAATPTVAPKPQAKPNDPTAKMARAYVSGKTTAPVDLKYEVVGKPEPNKDIEVELAFIPSTVVDSLTVNVASGTPGLDIVSGATANFGILKIEEVAHHKITVRSDRPEVLYFTVAATVNVANVNSTRTFSIPLIFGGTSAAPAAATATPQAKTDATGQKVESMPAPEKK